MNWLALIPKVIDIIDRLVPKKKAKPPPGSMPLGDRDVINQLDAARNAGHEKRRDDEHHD